MSLAEIWPEPRTVEALRHVPGGSGSARYAWGQPSGSIAVMPGEAATIEVLRHEKTREALIALVHRFAAYGLSWTAGEAAKITAPTREVAEAILRALPAGKALPKIAPDGDGGLMMVWEGGGPLLLTIDNFRLHAVIAAATPHAEYIDDMPFDEVEIIPRRILDAIPPR